MCRLLSLGIFYLMISLQVLIFYALGCGVLLQYIASEICCYTLEYFDVVIEMIHSWGDKMG